MSENNMTSDYLIKNVINDFKPSLKTKTEAFGLLLRLKQSIEFNSTVNWLKVFTDLGDIYKDPKPFYQSDKYTPDPIDVSTMTDKDIFVFGSNTEGNHGGGAARAAMNSYGAIMGQAKGLQGQSYGIVTLDYTGNIDVTFETMEQEVVEFFNFSVENPDLTFWVTKIGCGISGYTIGEISKLFKNKIIPPNVILPQEFVNIMCYEEYLCNPLTNTYYKVLGNNKIIQVNTTLEQMNITEINFNINSISSLIVSNKEEFINATETVLKQLY